MTLLRDGRDWQDRKTVGLPRGSRASGEAGEANPRGSPAKAGSRFAGGRGEQAAVSGYSCVPEWGPLPSGTEML